MVGRGKPHGDRTGPEDWTEEELEWVVVDRGARGMSESDIQTITTGGF